MNQLNIFILLIIILASCQGTNNNKEEIKEKKVEKIPLAFAQNFLIEKKGNIHIITIKTPWQKATEKIQYILYPKGKVAPEGYPKATKIAVPVSKIICTSTIDIAFLEALGATDKIAAISNGKFVYSPKVRGDLASNKILEIGANNAIDYEKALTLGADLALVYSVGAEQSFKKFKELGIPTVLMSDFMEKTPLGRAEWLVFVSYFLGLETEATLLFKDISQKYERIKNKAQSSSAPKPTVLTGAVYKGTWHIAGGKSLMAQLIKDAGGQYLWANNQETSGVPLDFEAVYIKALTVDCWINMSYYQTKKELEEADGRYQDFKAVKKGRIFNYFKRITSAGGSDVFESAIVKPYLLLNDFVQIFQQDSPSADSLYYYQQLQ